MNAIAGLTFRVPSPSNKSGFRLCPRQLTGSSHTISLSPLRLISLSTGTYNTKSSIICPRVFFQDSTDISADSSVTEQGNGVTEQGNGVSHRKLAESSSEYPTRALNEDAVEDDGQNLEDGYRMTRVSDRLIEVFLIEKTTPDDWRRLLAFSKEWRNIRDHFFKRCKAKAEQEQDPKMKGDLSKLCRKLKEVDDDMERHNDLLAYVKEREDDIEAVVASRRKDFTTDFFQHLELLYQAHFNQLEEQEDLLRLASKCAVAVSAHDKTNEEEAAISAAQMKFDDILNSPSLDIARNKIDELAKRNELDSTLMLLITKAWAAAKEATMMKEEVKDILYHLYMVARGNLQRLVPKDVRIMRHILSMEDPKEQLAALAEAFSPGAELEGKDIDLLYTTPEKLHEWIVIVLDAYYNDKRSSLMKSAQELMNPAIIKRLENLKRTIETQFL